MSQLPPNAPPPPPGYPPVTPPPSGSGSGRTLLWVTIAAVVAVLAVAAVLVVVLVTRGGDDDKDDRGDRKARADRSVATDSPSSGSTDEPDTDGPTSDAPLTTVDVPNTALEGQWFGRYRCVQGPSAGRLRLTAVEGSTTELTGVFRFSSSTNNPGTEPGAFRLAGKVVNGLLTLRPTSWINQPEGYIAVDMVGYITEEDPQSLDGDVNYSGCSTFHFARK